MKDYIFKGFHSSDQTEYLYDIDLIKRDLLNQFNTTKGERIMDTSYGFIGWDMLFELQNDYNEYALETDVTRIVESEPRVKLIGMSITKVEYGFTILVNLDYMSLGVDELFMTFSKENNIRHQ